MHFYLALVPWILSSQVPAEVDPIVTDRPDFTESSLVVPVGTLQVESGFTHVRDEGIRALSGPEILGRYGIAERIELRVGLPNYNWIDTSPRAEGFDDLYLGAKFQLGPIRNFDFALIPAVFIPAGRAAIRSESASPELKVTWGTDIGNGRSLTGMVYVSSVEEDGRRVTPFQHTLSLGIPVGPRTGMFVEHILDLRRGDRPAHTLHSGFVYQPNPNSQFDIHYGFGLTRNAPDFFIGVGYAVRF